MRASAQNGTQRGSRVEADVPTRGVLDEQQVLLSTLPPSRVQKRFALAIVLVLFAVFCATVPFATVPLPYFREFAAMFVISSITSALLFVQFSLVHSRALLAISGGYQRAPDRPMGAYIPGSVGRDGHDEHDLGTALPDLAPGLSPVLHLLHSSERRRCADTLAAPLAVFCRSLECRGGLVAVDIVAWFATSTSESMPRDVPLSMLFERSQSYWNGLLLLLTFSALAEATFRTRPLAHGRDVRFGDRTLSDFSGRSSVRRRMVCRTRLFPHFGDARADDIAFRNRFALCATRPLRDGGKSRTGNATDDDGRIIGLNRAR